MKTLMNLHSKLIISILSLYTLLVVCMGIATIIEKVGGTACASRIIYGSWWFVLLWAATAVLSVACLFRRKTHRRPAVLLLHLSFIVMLTGALVTHLWATEGTLHLRQGEAATAFTDGQGGRQEMPFSLQLRRFDIVNYPGTDAVMDYQAHLSVEEDGHTREMDISMNRIGKHAGYRFYQSSYDSDGRGTVLLVAHDPYGIALTYTGYLLLFVSLLALFISRHTHIRSLYRMATHTAILLFFLTGGTSAGFAAKMDKQMDKVIDKEIADEMGQVAVLYQGRICPLNTAATDFVTKLCGKSSWQGYSANEIFLGWTIIYTEWEQRKIIRVKHKEVQRLLGIEGKWACVRDFYTSQHLYKLKDMADDASLDEAVRKAIRETDEKIQVITMFYNSEMLRLFPLADQGGLTWHKPGSTDLPPNVGEAEFQFIHHAMDHLVKHLLDRDAVGARTVIAKIRLYQQDKAGDLLPSPIRLRAETWYNSLQSATWVCLLLLSLSLLFCWLSFAGQPWRRLQGLHTLYVWFTAAYLSLLLLLRWWVSGHVPMSNGYETMLFMAWVAMVVTLAAMRRMGVMKAFGPVVSSCCLLVAMMASGSPRMTPLMPVLQSPLLAIHVALVMMAYTLLTIMALLSLRCLLPFHLPTSELLRLTALSRLLLYPAVSLLASGIFIGAVWANISWGNYWSWDPKETWALITLMICAIPLHLPPPGSGSHHQGYHLFVLVAFLSVLMTYFGVNYYLAGLHSYA